jgi:polyisoprenoid-binding protein YceI
MARPELQASPEDDVVSGIAPFRRLAHGISALFVLAIAPVPAAYAAVVEYAIDTARTLVTFEARNLGFLTYRGRFGGASGMVQLDPQSARGSVDIVIDARSLSADSRPVEQFMRSAGLLDVERFPQIAYSARRIEFARGAPDRIVGVLTLLGITRPVTLAITHSDCLVPGRGTMPARCTMAATATFRRSEFGMNAYRAFASDEVKLVVDAVGVLAPM